MKELYSCKKYSFALVFAFTAALFISPAVFAQSDAEVQEALADVSALYGQSIQSVEEAHAVCNLEKYVTACAEIGKKHNLFTAEEVVRVDVLLIELKEGISQRIQSCETAECLLGVANELA